MVDIVNPDTGRRAKVVQSAFEKVWSFRGFVLASDYEQEQPVQGEESAPSTPPSAGEVGETGTGDSKQKPRANS